mgnify:CR=1 FL=1
MNAFQTEEGLVGISLRGDQLRMTEMPATINAQERKVLNVVLGQFETPFSFQVLEDRSAISKFADTIRRTAGSAGFLSNKASLAIDSSFVLIKKVPVDSSLQDDELAEHIDWEFSQSMISPPDHFIRDFEPLPAEGGASYEKHVVSVAVRKAVIDYLREIFAETDFFLQAIDVDVFAAQRVITERHDYTPDKKTALIDIRQENLQFSVLYKGFNLVQEISYPADEGLEVGHNKDERLARVISKELRRIILDNKLGKNVEDVDNIYIYGDDVAPTILDTLAQAHNVEMKILNPFEQIPLTDQSTDSQISSHPEAFVTSLGASIKGF